MAVKPSLIFAWVKMSHHFRFGAGFNSSKPARSANLPLVLKLEAFHLAIP